MKTKIFLILFVLLLWKAESFAQQKPVFSQYTFNPLAINPAFAGSQEQFSATALYRNQWVNLDGAPTTITASANSGIVGKRIGLGINISNDRVGVHNDLGLYISYAYRIKLNGGAFAMGIQAGFNNLKSDFTKLNLININDPNLSGIYNKLNPNFGAGVFYDKGSFYAGFSVPYLINSQFFADDNVRISDASSKRYYFLLIGNLFKITDRFDIKPEVLFRYQEGAPFGADINGKLILDKKIALGISYRTGDAIISTFEFQLNDNLRIGYSYEATLSSLNQFSRGSHEIMINYRIKIEGLNPRTDCPTYF